jgi:uncharacterized membrane protein
MTTPSISGRNLLHSILLSKGRMEALTDGIFAIAMTLLILELKVPDLPKNAGTQELLHRIREELPAVLTFVISFLYCGLLWLLHHLAMHFVRHLQVALVWINLVFLMSVSTMPFSCGILGHFLRNRAAWEIYYGNMFIAAALLTLFWLIARRRKLISEDDPQGSRLMQQRLILIPSGLAAGMIVSLFNPALGSYVFAAIAVSFRVWQRKSSRDRVTTPASPSS